MLKMFKKNDYVSEENVRPWVINQYRTLKQAQFTHDEILNVVSLNALEKQMMEKENNTFKDIMHMVDEVIDIIDGLCEEPVKEEIVDAEIVEDKTKEPVKEEIVDAEIVENKTKEEPSIAEQMEQAVNKISEKYEPVTEEVKVESVEKENKETSQENQSKEESVKESVVEGDPSKWTDEEVIEKALLDLTSKMEYQDKEEMINLLRESFNSDKRLITIYRNKYISHYKLVNNIPNNDKSTENKEEGGEKEIKSEVIESKEEGGKKVELIAEDNNKKDDLIDNEMLEMLVDDVFDQYKMIFNIKKDSLKNLIISVLKEKPEILKSNNYYFVCMRLCEIIENLIMENTIEENNEEDEILKQLNSLTE